MDSCFWPFTIALFPNIMEMEKKKITSRRYFFPIKQTVMSFHSLNYEYSYHHYSVSIALLVAGLPNPVDLAVYLLPQETQYLFQV